MNRFNEANPGLEQLQSVYLDLSSFLKYIL